MEQTKYYRKTKMFYVNNYIQLHFNPRNSKPRHYNPRYCKPDISTLDFTTPDMYNVIIKTMFIATHFNISYFSVYYFVVLMYFYGINFNLYFFFNLLSLVHSLFLSLSLSLSLFFLSLYPPVSPSLFFSHLLTSSYKNTNRHIIEQHFIFCYSTLLYSVNCIYTLYIAIYIYCILYCVHCTQY